MVVVDAVRSNKVTPWMLSCTPVVQGKAASFVNTRQCALHDYEFDILKAFKKYNNAEKNNKHFHIDS